MNKYNLKELNKLVFQVRRDIVRMVHSLNSGHPGGSLGCTEYFIALYKVIMNHNTHFSMDGVNTRFILFVKWSYFSCILFCISQNGIFSCSRVENLQDDDSRLQGHPTTYEGLPGVRIASGSLGQGLMLQLELQLQKIK